MSIRQSFCYALLFAALLPTLFVSRARAEDFVQQAHQRCNPSKPVEAAQVPFCEIDAASGNADAEAVICALYHSGTFLQQDFSNAANWCLKAAKQGRSRAQVMLGRIYGKGEGVPRDNAEAFAWLSVAAVGDPEKDKFARLARDAKDVLAVSMTKAEQQQADKRSSEYISRYHREQP
jgi:TPR repeat protein